MDRIRALLLAGGLGLALLPAPAAARIDLDYRGWGPRLGLFARAVFGQMAGLGASVPVSRWASASTPTSTP